MRRARRLGAALALALGFPLAGCSSDARRDDPGKDPPPGTAPKASPGGSRGNGEAQPDVIRIKGSSMPEASYLEKPADPGNCSMDVHDVDLERVVLTLFTKQTKVVVDYKGAPHKISLYLPNMPWRDALNVICLETRTHVVRSEDNPGHLEMRDGYLDTTTRTTLARFEDPPKK